VFGTYSMTLIRSLPNLVISKFTLYIEHKYSKSILILSRNATPIYAVNMTTFFYTATSLDSCSFVRGRICLPWDPGSVDQDLLWLRSLEDCFITALCSISPKFSTLPGKAFSFSLSQRGWTILRIVPRLNAMI
jgi:hypothetical protein